MGLRRRWWMSLAGLPHGLPGRLGVRLTPRIDEWGQWQWTDDTAQRLVEEAGFTDVTVSVMPVFSKALLARGVKPAAGVQP